MFWFLLASRSIHYYIVVMVYRSPAGQPIQPIFMWLRWWRRWWLDQGSHWVWDPQHLWEGALKDMLVLEENPVPHLPQHHDETEIQPKDYYQTPLLFKDYYQAPLLFWWHVTVDCIVEYNKCKIHCSPWHSFSLVDFNPWYTFPLLY